MGDVPAFDDRVELAQRIRDNEDVKLIDFSRDGYRFMCVTVRTRDVANELLEDVEDAGFEWVHGDGPMELIFRAPSDQGPERMSMGGNRL